MKRLLGLTGLTCLCTLTACFYLNTTVALITGGFALLLFVVSLLVPVVRKEGTLPVAFAAVFLSVLLFMCYTYFYVKPVQTEYDGKTCRIVATQKNEVYHSNGYYCYELDVKTIDSKEVNRGMVLYTHEHTFSDAYDELTFEAFLSAETFGSNMSKGLFFRSYLLYEDTAVEVYVPETKPLMYHIIQFREKLRNALYMEMSSDTADFSSAVLLGDKYTIETDVKALLRICGLSHIAVVSGLHLSIISSVLMRITRYLLRNKYLCATVNVLAILGFVLLTGCGIPVIRSAVMLIIYIVGTLIPRRSDSINSIGFAALFILLNNPYAVGDIGMLLSFSATIGIVVWSDKISTPVMNRLGTFGFMNFRFFRNIVKTIVYTIACSVCASLWTLPISILAFGGFSTVSVLSNLLTVPVLSVVIVCIILCAITHFIGFLPFISSLFAWIVNLYYEYLVFVCRLLSKIPYAYINSDKPYFYFWLSATLILIAVALLLQSKRGYRITIVASVFILLFGSAAYNLSRESVVTLHIPDTGSALSVVLESTDGHAVLSCGGSKWRTQVLCRTVEGIKTDENNLLVKTAEDNSAQYAEILMNEFDYEQVLLYDNKDDDLYSDSEYESENITVCHTDHTVNLWDKVQVELIVEDGVVYEYITAGSTSILLLPENSDCENLDDIYRNADIIITHGVVDNMGLLECDTLIIPGDDFIAQATAEISAPIAKRVITGTDIVYDIKLK